jgi:hypothetical protein
MFKFPVVITFLFGSVSQADSLICQLQESVSGQKTSQELTLGSFKG